MIYSKFHRILHSHTCSSRILNHDHRQATTRVVDQLIKDKFVHVGRVYKPRHIFLEYEEGLWREHNLQQSVTCEGNYLWSH